MKTRRKRRQMSLKRQSQALCHPLPNRTIQENVSNFFALLEKRGKETNCVRKPVRREKPSPNVVLRPSIIVMAIETEIGTEEETIVTYTGDRTRKGKKVGEMTEEETIPDRGETMRRVVEKKTGGERR